MSSQMFNIIALDIGDARIGVALANSVALISSTLDFIINDENTAQNILEVTTQNNAKLLIIGLPQDTQGNDTDQTKKIREFVNKLKQDINIPIKFSDESNTSQLAEKFLDSTGKKYSKGDIDSQSAAIILQRFIEDHNNDLTNIIKELE